MDQCNNILKEALPPFHLENRLYLCLSGYHNAFFHSASISTIKSFL